VWGVGFRVWGVGFRVFDIRCRLHNIGFRNNRVYTSGLTLQGLRFWVQGLGVRALGFRVCNLPEGGGRRRAYFSARASSALCCARVKIGCGRGDPFES
jgi:hypothetical protein